MRVGWFGVRTGGGLRVLAVSVVVVGSCSGVLSVPGVALGALRVPRLRWSPCQIEKRFQCATAMVPLDHGRPGGAMIRLALIRHPAADHAHRVGTLFFNPGGPGRAVAVFPQIYRDFFPAGLRARFDIVTWDPRGIGGSTPVRCFASEQEEERFFAGVPIAGSGFPVGRAQIDRSIRRYREFDRRCGRRNGALLEHLSTADDARDLDLLRQAVGARMIDYIGISYGTFLGATYANLFPDRVRAMDLDGDINPTAWVSPQLNANRGLFLDTWLRQRSDQGAAKTLGAFLDLCGRADTRHCAFSAGSPAATRAKWAALLRRLSRQPTGGNTNYAGIASYTVQVLYSYQSWRRWAEVLQEVWMNGKPATRLPTPSAVGLEEQVALLCSESPNPGEAAFRSQEAFAYRRSGAAGAYWWWGAEPCVDWPARASDRYTGPWNHRTARPVLVIGNTYDPATPYQGAVTMVRRLARARLLTVDGYGHTALTNPSACVERYMTRYFIHGSLPQKGARCRQNQQPFATVP